MVAAAGASERERLDVVLVERGLAPSRAKAQALILAGRVLSSGKRLEKPGQRIPRGTPLEIREARRYVGRGGHKLEGALRHLAIDATGRDALDVGASTGGFTQVLLEAGARRVVALDVGRGQLDWSLRRDPRVHVLEGFNARHLAPAVLPFLPSLAVVDVSFISLELVLPGVVSCLTETGEIVALVKPQFEVGRGLVGRGGIVRDIRLHRDVLRSFGRLAAERDWGIVDLAPSAIRGAEGNQEYFIHFRPSSAGLAPAALAHRIRKATAEDAEEGA
jgi:23S rRNA (cytidine1920-2'-O)/16S rRNA (cytidine1409-2'-O)-methyltransferase